MRVGAVVMCSLKDSNWIRPNEPSLVKSVSPPQCLTLASPPCLQANARFALSVEPSNPHLQQRAEEVQGLRSAGLPTVSKGRRGLRCEREVHLLEHLASVG